MKNNCTVLPRDEQGLTETEFLQSYDITKYPRPSVTLDNIVFGRDAEGRLTVLLIKRRNHPFIGKWAFPGGFLNMEEDLEEGAARELLEETGVVCTGLRQIGAYGRPERDPRGRIITVAFMAELPYGADPAAADDAAEAAMFTVTVDEAGRSIILSSEKQGLRFEIGYRFADGRALFIGPTELAGDHSQILADALLLRGEIKKHNPVFVQ